MKTKRNVYLKKKTLAEAQEILHQRFAAFRCREAETVSAPDAVGRILAEPVYARLSSPHCYGLCVIRSKDPPN